MLATVKFQQWYNQYHHIFSKALRDNCSLEYDLYLSGNATTRHGIVVDNDACTMVQSCIWDAQNAHIQLDMSAAAVLLGIAPTIISQVGSSLEETSLLFTRQPVLALLVGLVRPAICPTPPFSDASPLNRLYDQCRQTKRVARRMNDRPQLALSGRRRPCPGSSSTREQSSNTELTNGDKPPPTGNTLLNEVPALPRNSRPGPATPHLNAAHLQATGPLQAAVPSKATTLLQPTVPLQTVTSSKATALDQAAAPRRAATPNHESVFPHRIATHPRGTAFAQVAFAPQTAVPPQIGFPPQTTVFPQAMSPPKAIAPVQLASPPQVGPPLKTTTPSTITAFSRIAAISQVPSISRAASASKTAAVSLTTAPPKTATVSQTTAHPKTTAPSNIATLPQTTTPAKTLALPKTTAHDQAVVPPRSIAFPAITPYAKTVAPAQATALQRLPLAITALCFLGSLRPENWYLLFEPHLHLQPEALLLMDPQHPANGNTNTR